MKKENFLKNLKVDDKVGIETHYHGLQLSHVVRITKTLIVTDKGRFKKHNGHSPSSGYTTSYLVEATKEFHNKFYHQFYINNINHFINNNVLNNLSNVELISIYSILEKRK